MKKQRKKNPPREKPSATLPAKTVKKGKVFGTTGVSAALTLLTLIVFWSARSNEFVNLDDQVYVTENVHVQGGLNWTGIVWAFTNLDAGFWHPLTWISIMLDCHLFNLDPGGHHFTSVLLHAANAVLLFVVLHRMTGAHWRSTFVAALFALHPLHVETVAWAADRKDVLSTLFWLLTMLTYLRYVEAIKRKDINGNPVRAFPKVWGRYVLSLFFFVCAIMSKTMVVTLPLILLLMDWWPLGRLQKSNWKASLVDKIPFLTISFAAGLMTIHAEKGVGAVDIGTQYPLQFRLANAVLSTCRYLAQTFWPVDLSVFYPYQDVFPIVSVAGATLLLMVITGVVIWRARKHSYLVMGWFWFVLTLSPVIGIIQVGAHSRADRYTYVPLIGVFVMLTWGAYDLTKRWQQQKTALSVAGVAALLALTVCTAQQLGYWRNSGELFRHALQVTKNNYVGSYCLGLYLSDHGNDKEAVDYYRQSLAMNPAYGEAWCNLGLELAMAGNIDEATEDFKKAVRFAPRLAGAHSNLGLAYENQHKLGNAISEYRESIRLKPDDARVYANLGRALDEQGKRGEALDQYRIAIQLAPAVPQMHLDYAAVLAEMGRRDEAIAECKQALQLDPNYADAREQLSRLLAPATK